MTGAGGNLPPSFTAVLAGGDAFVGVEVAVDYDAVDPDGDPVTFGLVEGPVGASLDPATGAFAWTPGETQAGQAYTVRVSASDGKATATTVATLTVFAEQPDRAPSFVDPTYVVVTSTGGSVSVVYSATDPEGTAVTYALADAPSGASAAVNPSTGAFSWTAPETPGVYPFAVTATDGAGLATRVDLFVGVQGTLFPELSLADLRAAVRSAYTGTTLGYDRGRDTLYARVSGYPDGLVEDVYTGFSVQLDPSQDPSTYLAGRGINAEHTWPQSMGASSEPQRSDMHILYPAKSNVNGSRGNDPYGEVPDTETQTWYRLAESQTTIPPAATRDEWSERGPAVFEPREAVKGDLARAVLYFAAVYEQAADAAFLEAVQETALAWDVLDPASPAEVLRSGLIARYQGNVNPFVLDPSLARRMVDPLATEPQATPETPENRLAISVQPNPTRGAATVSVRLATPSEVRVTVYDALGRRVVEAEARLPAGASVVPLGLSSLPVGVYAVRLTVGDAAVVRRVTVAR